MKKILFILFIFLFANTSALNFDYISSDIGINRLDQSCTIEDGSNLNCSGSIDISLINQTYGISSISFTENLGAPHAEFNETKILLCDWVEFKSNQDYQSYNLTSCNKSTAIKNKINNSIGYLSMEINTTGLRGRDIIYFEYMLNGFVVGDPAYNNIFLNTHNLQNTTIWRSLILPKNSAIDSLYNFKIIAQRADGRWVIAVDKEGQATASYRDIGKEQNERNRRDATIIALSFAVSLIIGFLFSDKKMSERTKHIWIITGAFLFITCWILLFKFSNAFFTWLLLICYVLFFVSVFFAMKSAGKDHKNYPFKRKILNILKFIKGVLNL